jgi:pantetheine-phosphate adenylyltransferase
MAKAIYAFSGDPITFGHIDIIKRAAKVFDELIVGIGANPDKKYLFSLEERRLIAEKALVEYPNVKVVSFKGLLVDYAYENNIPTIIRGLRNSQDFNYELTLSQIGESQKLDIDTFFIPAHKELAHVSSSAVKALQVEQGLIHEYVPLFTKQKLEEKLSQQYILGITGEIGVGKFYIYEKFKKLGQKAGIDVHRIDIDSFGHEILEVLQEPLYINLRKSIIAKFGLGIAGENGTINSKALGKLLFGDLQKLHRFNEIIYRPLLLRLRRELYGKKGIILLDSALIIESEMTYLCNNNLILVTADKETQLQRIKQRKLTEEQIRHRTATQYTSAKKARLIQAQIEREKQGTVYNIDNSSPENTQKVEALFQQIITDFNIK